MSQNNELLKEIEEDKILKSLIETVKETTENAQSLQYKAEMREAQLLNKLNHYDRVATPNTYDLDEIEEAVVQNEKADDISRKIKGIRDVKNKVWTGEKNYREAIAQYYTYITPILTEIEEAKQESRIKIAEIKSRYNKELADAEREFNSYENKVKEFFTLTGDLGLYIYQKGYESQFGKIARSDYFAAIKAESFSKPIIEEPVEKGPKITKHESLNGIENYFKAQPSKYFFHVFGK